MVGESMEITDKENIQGYKDLILDFFDLYADKVEKPTAHKRMETHIDELIHICIESNDKSIVDYKKWKLGKCVDLAN